MNPMLPDDTESLRRHLPGGHFHYRDISSDRARQGALERWPLLAEVASARCNDDQRRSRPANPSPHHP